MTQKGKHNFLTIAATQGKELSPAPARDRRLPLKTCDHVRAEMARIYRSAKFGELPLDAATRLIYILSAISKIISDSDIERRITALERESE